MSLIVYKKHFDNSYQEVFNKVLVGKSIANLRFEKVLTYGESVERAAYDISGVRVRDVSRGSASVIDKLADTSELLTINIEKEAVFHISDGEVKQAGPLNPGEVIGGQVAVKVATDLDSRILNEVKNAGASFDAGDLTTGSSNGTPFALNESNVPKAVVRMPAKLRSKNQILTNLAWVIDSYGASDIEQYLMGKNIDVAGAVFKNGYAGEARNATMIVSENLTGEALLTATAKPAANDTLTINEVEFTFVTALSEDGVEGEVVIGANLEASLTNLAAAINAPDVTSTTYTAVSEENQLLLTDNYHLSAEATPKTIKLVGMGSGRLNIVSSDENIKLTNNFIHSYYGKKKAIDVVVMDLAPVDMRPTDDRRGTNVFSSYLAGIKTFADGAQKFLDVKISA